MPVGSTASKIKEIVCSDGSLSVNLVCCPTGQTRVNSQCSPNRTKDVPFTKMGLNQKFNSLYSAAANCPNLCANKGGWTGVSGNSDEVHGYCACKDTRVTLIVPLDKAFSAATECSSLCSTAGGYSFNGKWDNKSDAGVCGCELR